MRREILSWADVDKLVDTLRPQFRGAFDAMLMITRGGIIPGGLIGESLDIRYILTAAVRFPTSGLPIPKLAALPEFLQFPEDHLLQGRRILLVDDVWGSGRTITAVKDRVMAGGGRPETCVFHFNPYRSLFTRAEPAYYGAITDAFIVYPWEIDRGADPILARTPMHG
jgi:uncharacterized protein